MAKPLLTAPPSSSVARLLDPGQAHAALAERPAPPNNTVLFPAPAAQVPDIKREFILTEAADDTLSHAIRMFSKATGTNVTNSHFLRAVLSVLAQAMPEIEREASHLGRLKRPSNARGKEFDRDAYERRLAAALHAGIRASRPME